jgi:antitoxin ParD1/3/4
LSLDDVGREGAHGEHQPRRPLREVRAKANSQGRYQNVSEVVRAGLRMLEDYEMARQERLKSLKARINDAWEDRSQSRPAANAFDRIEKLHADMVATSKNRRA